MTESPLSLNTIETNMTSILRSLNEYIDNKLTEFERHMNLVINSAIDAKIDAKLHSLGLIQEPRILTIEKDIAKIKRNRHYEEARNIGISERSKTDNIYRILNAITVGVRQLELKHFYGPTKKIGEITEFDGLLLVDKSRLDTISRNPIINPHDRNGAVPDVTSKLVIIEAKTTLNKMKVDNKLMQLLQIHNIINDIHTGSIRLDQTSEQFRKMVQENNVASFPSEVIMIFAPDIIDTYTIDYIKSIADGGDLAQSPISEETYHYHCQRFLRRYIIESNILNDRLLPSDIKDAINTHLENNRPTASDFTAFITLIRGSSIQGEHKQNILNIYKPYATFLPVLTYAHTRAGIYYNNQLESPFGILSLGHLNHRGGVRRKLLTRKK
jgi:hypothetical protein